MPCVHTTPSGGASRSVVERLPLEIKSGESLKPRVFVDQSVAEVYAKERQAVCRRVYLTRADNMGVQLFASEG